MVKARFKAALNWPDLETIRMAKNEKGVKTHWSDKLSASLMAKLAEFTTALKLTRSHVTGLITDLINNIQFIYLHLNYFISHSFKKYEVRG